MATARVQPPGTARRLMQIDPSALCLIATIADSGSLTAAARELALSQPALTKQLRKVEQMLGVALFQRSMRGVQPTEYGLALLPRARIVRTQVQQAVEEVSQMRGRREGRVTIALSHLAMIALLPEVLPPFREAWPQVVLRIEPPAFPDRFVGLREGAPDFAVVTLPPVALGREYTVRPLCATSVVAVVRPGHPLAKAKSLAALTGAEWIMPNLQSSTARTVFAAFERLKLPPPRCLVSCETLTGLEVLVASSDLIGAVPLEVYDAKAKSTGLVRLGPGFGPRGSSLALIHWTDSRPTPAAAHLAELFVRSARVMERARKTRRH
jgi:LysR family transcriptional regulator of abg operon